MKLRNLIRIVVIAASFCAASYGAIEGLPGTIDPSFDPHGGVVADGFHWIHTIALDRDGNVLVAGKFSEFDHVPRNGIARLHRDGSLDEAFDPGAQLPVDYYDGPVRAIVPLPDGKILLGGTFTNFGAVARANLVRLNADGTLDPEFAPGLVPMNTGSWFAGVYALAFQADGKLVVGGSFGLPRPFELGTATAGTARLNSDGSVDATFQPVKMAWWAESFVQVTSLVPLPDQRIIYAGYFDPFYDPFTWHPIGGVGSVKSDGSWDLGFTWPDKSWYSTGVLVGQQTGAGLKLLLPVGQAGTDQTRLIRLTPEGLVDQTFQPPAQVSAHFPVPSVVQSDGKILVRWGNGIARLFQDGALDQSFDLTDVVGDRPGLSQVLAIGLQPDGKVLAAGRFNKFKGQSYASIVRLFGGDPVPAVPIVTAQPIDQTARGGQTVSFSPRVFSYVTTTYQWLFNGTPMPGATNSDLTLRNVRPENSGTYSFIATNPQGSILSSNATLSVEYTRALGAVDLDFFPEIDPTNSVYAAASLRSGKILVGGRFDRSSVGTNQALLRLNSDGTVDKTFHVAAFSLPSSYQTNAQVSSVLLQEGDRPVVSGLFTAIDGVSRFLIARFSPEGLLDETFQAASSNRWTTLRALGLQSDQRLFVEVYGWAKDFVHVPGLARIGRDGAIDPSFDSYSWPFTAVDAIAIQPDGKILAAGYEPLEQGILDGRVKPAFYRLNADGSRDKAFVDSSQRPNCCSLRIAVEADGHIVFGGRMSATSGPWRLNPDGSVDHNFVAEVSSNRVLSALAVDAAGRIIAAIQAQSSPSTQIYWLGKDGQADSHHAELDGAVSAMTIQGDGNVLVAGSFKHVNGAPRPGLARLLGDALSVPLRLSSIAKNGSRFSLRVQTVAGRRYVLESKESLTDAVWRVVVDFPGDGTSVTATDDAATAAQRFYRVRVE